MRGDNSVVWWIAYVLCSTINQGARSKRAFTQQVSQGRETDAQSIHCRPQRQHSGLGSRFEGGGNGFYRLQVLLIDAVKTPRRWVRLRGARKDLTIFFNEINSRIEAQGDSRSLRHLRRKPTQRVSINVFDANKT